MTNRTIMPLIGAALLLGAAASAHAETGKAAVTTDFTVRTDTSAIAPGNKTLKWDAARGRWGVTLNVQENAERGAQWNNVQAGAYFRVTPSLRIGGAVALGEQDVLPAYKKTVPQDAAPRVRLETAFKF
jgi:hypothetical protein